MMARIRSIKPEFWTSAQVLECSPNARLLFIGLWTFCDDAGRHVDKPKQVKAEVYPADDLTIVDIEAMLDELDRVGLIQRYTVDGERYFCITGWHHQRIDKPQPAKYPGPVGDGSGNAPRTLPPDTIRKDRIGKDKKGSAATREEEPPAAVPADPKPAAAADADAAERKHQINRIMDIGVRLCAVAGIDHEDPRWHGDFGCLAGWLASGADPDLDIIPAAEAVMAKRRRTDPKFVPKSLAYFREAVEEARQRRTNPAAVPRGSSPPSTPPRDRDGEYRVWMRLWRQHGRWVGEGPRPDQPNCVVPPHIRDEALEDAA